MRNYSNWKNFLKNLFHYEAKDSVKGFGPISHWHNFFKSGNCFIIVLFCRFGFFSPGYCVFKAMTYTTDEIVIIVYVQAIL